MAGLFLAGWTLLATAQIPSIPEGHPYFQLNSSVDQRVVGLGEPFVFTVEAFATPATADEEADLERRFTALVLAYDSLHFELVRTDSVSIVRDSVESDQVLRMSKPFIIRARKTGILVSPSVSIDVGGIIYQTGRHQVGAYRVDQEFFRAGRSIVPIVAEGLIDNRLHVTTGTAFLIAPDALVTSYHVIVDAFRVRIFLPNGAEATTRKAWAVDARQDIAILWIDPKTTRNVRMSPLELAPDKGVVSAAEQPQDDHPFVFTNGWPVGIQRSTAGFYYRNALVPASEFIWVSSNPLLPGDSGGPLLDARGRVLAVVTSGTINRGADVLREYVCFATDVRPALWKMKLARKPRSLSSLLKRHDVVAEPRSDAIRLSTRLNQGRRRLPDLDRSLARIEAGTMASPEDARLSFMRGSILDLLGSPEKAREAFQSSLAADSDYFPSAYMLALHHLSRKEYAEAQQLFDRLRQVEPYIHLGTYGLALSYIGRLKYEQAAGLLREVVLYDPTFGPAYFDLGRCYVALGEEVRARQLVAKLNQCSPSWASQLRQILKYPALRLVRLSELPRAHINLLPSIQ